MLCLSGFIGHGFLGSSLICSNRWICAHKPFSNCPHFLPSPRPLHMLFPLIKDPGSLIPFPNLLSIYQHPKQSRCQEIIFEEIQNTGGDNACLSPSLSPVLCTFLFLSLPFPSSLSSFCPLYFPLPPPLLSSCPLLLTFFSPWTLSPLSSFLLFLPPLPLYTFFSFPFSFPLVFLLS